MISFHLLRQQNMNPSPYSRFPSTPYHLEHSPGMQPCCSSPTLGLTHHIWGAPQEASPGVTNELCQNCWLKTREDKEGIRCEGMKYHCTALVQDVSCNYLNSLHHRKGFSLPSSSQPGSYQHQENSLRPPMFIALHNQVLHLSTDKMWQFSPVTCTRTQLSTGSNTAIHRATGKHNIPTKALLHIGQGHPSPDQVAQKMIQCILSSWGLCMAHGMVFSSQAEQRHQKEIYNPVKQEHTI